MMEGRQAAERTFSTDPSRLLRESIPMSPQPSPTRFAQRLTGSSFDRFKERAGGAVPLLISCLIHTCILITLALIYTGADEIGNRLVVFSGQSESDDLALEATDVDVVTIPPSDEPIEFPVTTEPTPVTPVEPPPIEIPIEPLARDLPGTGSAGDAGLGEGDRESEELLGAIGELLASKSGGGSGAGGVGSLKPLADDGSKKGAKFFGSYAVGQRFVFVVDSSMSMAGPRWIRACEELLYSIAKLEEGQEFIVICFDFDATAMFNLPVNRLQYFSNTSEARVQLQGWLANHPLKPATFPATAMLAALKLEPDAIFLLSDGELQDDTLFMLRRMNGRRANRGKIPIHTINLMSLLGQQTLRAIAGESSGSYNSIMQ